MSSFRLCSRATVACRIALGLFVVGAASPLAAQSCVSLTALGSAVAQNFDAMGTTAGAWTDNSTIVGAYSTQATFLVGTGTANSGGLYSFGAASAADRAFGSVASGSAEPINALCFTNDTGAALTSLAIAYTGEQWRNGGNIAAQALTTEYQIASAATITDANVPSTGWIAASSLDFTSPTTGAGSTALDGNAAANRTAIAATLTVDVPLGQEFWIRWKDVNDAGSDHGLAVDDFSISPAGGPPTGLSISDVSLSEGNTGTTSFDFTVSLSAPAPSGGVSFDIATADGSATAGADYVASSLTGQTIAAGATSYTFSVLVNGDTSFEADETFFVDVTNVVGAPVLDGQGLGTIVNDDTGAALSINDLTQIEGDSGTSNFSFTVSLTQPAPVGGVNFDIATSNGTATSPSDYAAQSLTSQSIPAGSSSYSFNVVVNGDTLAEADETFLVNVSNVVNALVVDAQGQGTIINDDVVKIHDLQGSGAVTPIGTGVVVSVEGVVTASFQGATSLSGFFVQEEDIDIDADPLTSEGIFVFCSTCPTAVVEGQRVRVSGTVSEYFAMTQINATTAGSVTVISTGNHLSDITPATVVLPVVGSIDEYYEPREGMLVRFTDALSVAEYFELNRYGQIELFQGGRPHQFTETNVPTPSGYSAHLAALDARRVILDDENNTQNSLLNLAEGFQFAYYPRQNGGLSVGTQSVDFFRGGDIVNNLTGVLHRSFAGLTGTDAWRIRPTQATPPVFIVANPRPATAPQVGGAIKVASVNVLNYFSTIDETSSSTSGPCGPAANQDCRGADSVAELNRQRERTSIVLCGLNADAVGLMEIENTSAVAIADLLGAVNARCGGSHPYVDANAGNTLGNDAIRVQIIYRDGVLAPFGAPIFDLDPINNRPTLGVVFDVVDSSNAAFGERFSMAANHLKSKGCSGAVGGDADASDGQGCYSATRTAQAARLLSWINSTLIPAAGGDTDVMLVGDFNSYAQEPPITTLVAGGYVDLETSLLGTGAYSYLFDGQLGHLDYALASSSLASKVTGVESWHINADEVPLFDYNDEIRDAGEAAIEKKPNGSLLSPPRTVWESGVPYRASDHDPVLVGLFGPVEVIFRNGFDAMP